MKKEIASKGNLILFCGLPVTLKSYLSVRLSGKMGYAYLPTRAVGEIDTNSNKLLYQNRMERYKQLSEIVKSTITLGANVIVDGGFPTAESRSIIFKGIDPKKIIIVHCISDKETKEDRLKKRSIDRLDYENINSQKILKAISNNEAKWVEENPENELISGNAIALLQLNTSTMKFHWKGLPPKELSQQISATIKNILFEYSKTIEIDNAKDLLQHFEELSDIYDISTNWRTDKQILNSLRSPHIPSKARVLDIGTGTGLASEWYSGQGCNVIGIDISPKMLQKAAERINFVLLADATKLPFIDNYFDIIIARQCLHYLEPIRLLNEVKRTLKTNGYFAVSSVVCPNERTKTFWREFKNVTQPLRLDVFTSHDIIDLLRKTQLKVENKIEHSLIRNETVLSIEHHSKPISGGLLHFLKNMEQLSKKLFPELELRLKDDVLTYKQHWVTIWCSKST